MSKLTNRLALIAALLSGVTPAWADTMPSPQTLITTPLPCPLGNCVIATGGTSQVALNASKARKMWCLSNPSTATEPLFYDLGNAATVTNSLSIPPGGQTCMGGGLIWQGTINVNAASTSHQFAVEDFQ